MRERNAAVFQILLEQLIHRLLGDPAVAGAQKQRPGRHRRRLPVALDGGQRRSADRDHALLRTLAHDPQRFADEIHVFHIQREQFGNPQPARVEQFENRRIPQWQPRRRFLVSRQSQRHSQQLVDLRDRQHHRQAALRLRQQHLRHRAARQPAAQHQEFVKRPQRRKPQPDRRPLEALLHQREQDSPGNRPPPPPATRRSHRPATFGKRRARPDSSQASGAKRSSPWLGNRKKRSRRSPSSAGKINRA